MISMYTAEVSGSSEHKTKKIVVFMVKYSFKKKKKKKIQIILMPHNSHGCSQWRQIDAQKRCENHLLSSVSVNSWKKNLMYTMTWNVIKYTKYT